MIKNINLYVFIISIVLTIGFSKLVYVATVFRHGARYPIGNIYDGK